MTTLIVNEKGRITLSKDLLEHMGIQGLSKVSIEMLPKRRLRMKPVEARESPPMSADR